MLNLTNAKGEIVDRFHADIGNTPAYNVLREIHELARRQVFDIDGNIDKALKYLKDR